MLLNKNRIIDIIKIILASIILTAGILLGTKYTSDSRESTYFEDYITESEDNKIDKNFTGHETAEEIEKPDICKKNYELCKKIFFSGDFSSIDKDMYLVKADLIVSFVTEHHTQKNEFLPILESIKINEEGGKRGYATWNNVVLNIGDMGGKDEFYQVSTHELGHIIDLGYIQGIDKQKDKQYTEFRKAVFSIDDPSILFYKLSRENESIRKAESKKQNFCSTYGMSDPFEDFAECFNLYINHNKLFKFLGQKDKILGQKYNFLANMFDGMYINGDIGGIEPFKNKSSERVRDTTKISSN